MENVEELRRKVRELEERIEWYEENQKHLENLIDEYNELVKKQFEDYDELMKEIGSRTAIDPITRTYNRNYIMKLMGMCHQKAFEDKKKYALIFLDVDKFGRINERYGRDAGDKVLTRIARFLKANLRIPLDIIGRIGADEFLVLLMEISKDDAIKVAKRLHENLGEFEMKLDGENLKINVSVSMVHYPEDGNSVEELLELGEELINRTKAERDGGLRYLG